jgi:hypothetical protein
MTMVEDPSKQLSYLQQCLSSDKKPLGLFLGAGCPMAIRSIDDSPLIPDIAGITKIVCDDLAKDDNCKTFLKIVEEHFKKDGRGNPTVEDMLSHVRSLRAVAGQEDVRGLSAENLDKLDNTICKSIYEVVDKELPDAVTPYHCIASWVDAVQREKPIEIFTTNYDLLMEQAFENSRVPYFDGFAGVRKPFFDLRAIEEDVLPSRWARLWKLHGSINWYQANDHGVFRGTTREEDSSKRIIHPSHLKFQESRRMPYLAMMDRLRAFLKQPTATLILCGYSFRDQHINEVIVQGLQSTQTAVAFALLFGELTKNSAATALAFKRSNLNVLARDGALIGGRATKWLEKDEESVSADNSAWVKWSPVDFSNEAGKQSPVFILGDFSVFGQFLDQLVGAVHRPREVANA